MKLLQKPLTENTYSEGAEQAPDPEVGVLGIFTTLDLANKRAGEASVALGTRHLLDVGRDGVEKTEQKMRLRGLLKWLDQDMQPYDETVDADDGSVGRFWVIKSEVQGPRN